MISIWAILKNQAKFKIKTKTEFFSSIIGQKTVFLGRQMKTDEMTSILDL